MSKDFIVEIIDAPAFVPHPFKSEVAVSPGPALATGTWNGFGRKLCVSVEDATEPFEFDDEIDREEGSDEE